MKANFLAKGKWYIFGIIAVVIILSIGLSFCTWENSDISKLISSSTGNYGDKYAIGVDSNNNNIADIGDTIYFGNYYQDTNSVNKRPLEWRVVDIISENNKSVMYLWSEKVIAYGNFYGLNYYFDDNGNEIVDIKEYSSRYSDSTLRAWLNSEARSDIGGVGFAQYNANNHIVFKGFYNEAFNATEKNKILIRTISGAYGSAPNKTTKEQFGDIVNQKVWVPSITELYGRVQIGLDNLEGTFNSDAAADKQFRYFAGKDNSLKRATTTQFATTLSEKGLANYSKPNLKNSMNNNISDKYFSKEIGTYCYTRTPGYYGGTVILYNSLNGEIHTLGFSSYGNYIGVRPAICIER